MQRFIQGIDYLNNRHYIFIYHLIDPLTQELCYVGQTGDVIKRYDQHCTWRGCSSNHFKAWWIARLMTRDRKPIMTVVEAVRFDQADQSEHDAIRACWNAGHPLLNAISGKAIPRCLYLDRLLRSRMHLECGAFGNYPFEDAIKACWHCVDIRRGAQCWLQHAHKAGQKARGSRKRITLPNPY
jgi:hypothetical protein